MTDQVVPEPWHIPRALSNEALRLLTTLPMDEIERRLRMDGPAVPEGREPAAVEGQLSDGEVAKLVALIREISLAWEPDVCLLGNMTAGQLTRAAALLERQADPVPLARLPKNAQVIEPANHTILAPIPAPIPVSERLPRPEDCDREGRCWFYTPASSVLCGYWVLRVPDHMRKWETHWLPAHALPLPEVNDD